MEDQATTQEHIAPAPAALEPPKAPEEAQGIKSTEDAEAPEARLDAEPATADATSTLPVGTAASGGEKQDDVVVPEAEPAAVDAEPAAKAADDPVTATAPVGTTDGGDKQGDIAPKKDDPVMTGALGNDDVAAAPANEAVKPADVAATTNGAEKPDVEMAEPAVAAEPVGAGAPATGDKRKAEDELPAPSSTNGDAKKAKTDDNATNGAPAVAAASTNGKTTEAKKPGRPSKKGKKPIVEKVKEVVGRTLRKTRSQGPIDQ